MKKNEPIKRILIIHGPNMNLISLRTTDEKYKITLDKINKILRKEAQKQQHQLKILQTNDESAALSVIQKQRKKILGIIIFPGPWQKSAYALKDTLDLIQIPYITISTGENPDILKGILNIQEKDLLKGCKLAIEKLTKLI